jgi:DNA-binding winged helix-turn-helix (wHTH) protein
MDVVLLRWPAEAGARDRLSVEGEPRLLLVEEGQMPPTVIDCLEDWIRVPAAEEDVRARVDALAVRGQVHQHSTPGIDEDGVLRHRGLWVSLPPLEARLVTTLLQRFGAVVGRETLIRTVWQGGSPGRNALDVHVLRLRRRIAPLGLAVRTVRSRGYLLEATSSAETNGHPPAAELAVGAAPASPP